MAFGGSQNENMIKNVQSVLESDTELSVATRDEETRKNSSLSLISVQSQEKEQSLMDQNKEDNLCCNLDDLKAKLNELVGANVSDRNLEDFNQSSDSLSSSASVSDSDLTSTDSEDSLALSESESITDVTPLNSPYCDSPLPQSRNIDLKSDDRNLSSPCRNCDYDGSGDYCHRPEVNVLMKAIEKLEATNSSEFDFRETMMRRRAASFSNDESKKIELENQRLFKRVISKQNRLRSMYSPSNLPASKSSTCRHQESMKSDGDNSARDFNKSKEMWCMWCQKSSQVKKNKKKKGNSKKSAIAKIPKPGDKNQIRRRQKCLSHPSYSNPLSHLSEKKLLSDGLACKDSGKKKHASASNMKSTTSQNVENCEDAVASSTAAKSPVAKPAEMK